MWVTNGKSSVLRTQLWGEPVLRVMGEEKVLFILTDWGLLVRKKKIINMRNSTLTFPPI